MLEEREEIPQKWSSNTFKLNGFLERFPLPQTVKVVEGVFTDEEDQETVCIDDILIFHNCEKILKVKASDFRNETTSLACDTKVTRVASEFAHARLSARDILKHLSKVRFLRMLVEDDENGLERNEKLRIDYNSVQNHGDTFSFVLESITKQSKQVEITQSCTAHFQPILDPNEYNISEIVKKFGLPQHVLVVNNLNSTHTICEEESHGRVVKLESTFTESIVNVSNLLEPNAVFRLQTNLELVICPTLDAVLQGTSPKASDMISPQTSKDRKSEKDPKDASLVIYEDMSSLALDGITSLETLGKSSMQSQVLNAYTPTPSAMAMIKANAVSQKPHGAIKLKERGSENVIQLSEGWYDVPKSYAAEKCEGKANLNVGKLKSVEGEDKDHIYQEIDFRALIEAKKRVKAEVSLTDKDKEHQGENASASATKLDTLPRVSSKLDTLPRVSSKLDTLPRVSSKLDTLPRVSSNRKTAYYNITQHLSFTKKSHDITTRRHSSFQLNEKESTNKSKDFIHKTTQESSVLNPSDHTAVLYNRSVSTNVCDESLTSMWTQKHNRSSTSQRSHSIGCLEGTGSLGGSISDALTKHKMFVSRSGKANVVPPLPPPRLSSIKPVSDTEICAPGEQMLHKGLSNQDKHPVGETYSLNEKTSKTAAGNNSCSSGQQPLPTGSVRTRSVSAPHIHEAKNFKHRDFELPCCSHEAQLDVKKMHEKEHPSDPGLLLRSKTELPLETRKPRAKAPKPPIVPKPEIPALSHKQKLTTVKEKGPQLENKSVQGCYYNSLPRQKPPNTTNEDLFSIPDDLTHLSVSEVCACLKKLHLETLVDFFKQNLIDGEMLMELDNDTMVEMGIERFHRLKLKKFIDGWRPSL